MDESTPLEIPFRALSSGLSAGVAFTLDLQAEEYDCPVYSSRGFKAALHSSTSNPFILDHGFSLSPGKEYFLGVTPSYVYAKEGIFAIQPETR